MPVKSVVNATLRLWADCVLCVLATHHRLSPNSALMPLSCPVLFRPRLDNDVGTGVHLTPTGVEFDERRLTLGNSTEVRQRVDG